MREYSNHWLWPPGEDSYTQKCSALIIKKLKPACLCVWRSNVSWKEKALLVGFSATPSLILSNKTPLQFPCNVLNHPFTPGEGIQTDWEVMLFSIYRPSICTFLSSLLCAPPPNVFPSPVAWLLIFIFISLPLRPSLYTILLFNRVCIDSSYLCYLQTFLSHVYVFVLKP